MCGKTTDKVNDTIKIAKAKDISGEVADIVKILDRSSGVTKSRASLGRKIIIVIKRRTNLFEILKNIVKFPELDCFDKPNRIIYELKPMNKRRVIDGIRQFQKYNEATGGECTLILELY